MKKVYFTFTKEDTRQYWQLLFSDEIEEETGNQIHAGYIDSKGNFEPSVITLYDTFENARNAYFDILATGKEINA